MSALADLTLMAESYGYQLRVRLWVAKGVWWADVLVLEQGGLRSAYQRVKSTSNPGGQLERAAGDALQELRRVHKAKWRGAI